MKPLPLEDSFADVLGKAQRGLNLSSAELAARTGLPADALEALLAGQFNASAVRAVAPVLGLASEALVALGEGTYQPEAVSLDGLFVATTPFGDMTVNAFLVGDAATGEAAIFDTGSDGDELLAEAARAGWRISQIFLTHGHGDHIYDLDRLVERTGAASFAPRGEGVAGAAEFAPGATFAIGSLTVETRATHGHAPAGVTYVVRGLARPLAVCGDTVFAGSMGGGKVSYADALRTNREAIYSLSDDTVLAPGHGPLTTVGEQRGHNPFFSNP